MQELFCIIILREGSAIYHFSYLSFSFSLIPRVKLMSLGFVKESLDAIVGGVVASIQEAHESRQPGKLYLNSGLLAGANINRSPAAYVRNPKEERMK